MAELSPGAVADCAVIQAGEFGCLLDALRARGYTVVGPTVRDNAIIYDELASMDDLPIGWTDEQSPGQYRLKRRNDRALFGYTVGPTSWKRWLFPPDSILWRATREASGFRLQPSPVSPPKLALLAVRPCDLHAIKVQDRVFLGNRYVDTIYADRRGEAFLAVVQCNSAASTCFCGSMGSGPVANDGFDIAITEVMRPGSHRLVVEPGSDRGRELLADVPHAPATEDDLSAAERARKPAANQPQRSLNREGLKEVLYRNYEHPRWDAVAERCLTCGNCTMVCPTCFCSTVEEVTDLAATTTERHRRWDSCFSMEFSYIHGGSVRYSPSARYRQWLTHKLGTWQDQFGTCGCVGCGRCITWCPVGIDITEEAAAIRVADRATEGGEGSGIA